MSKVTHKLIRIPHRGPILAKGGMCGPIINPYKEDVITIFRMISSGVKVVEVLDDKKEIEIDATNFDKDNNVVEEKKAAPVTQPAQAQNGNAQQNQRNQFQNNRNQGKHQGQHQQQKPAEVKTDVPNVDATGGDKKIEPDAVESK